MGNMGRKLMGFGTAWLERQVFVSVCVCKPVEAPGSACLPLWAMCSQCRSRITCACVKRVYVCVCVCASAYLSCIFGQVVAFLSVWSRVLGDQLNAKCHINRCESYGHLTTASNQTAVIYYTLQQACTHTRTHTKQNAYCIREKITHG